MSASTEVVSAFAAHDEHVHSMGHYVKVWAALTAFLAVSFAVPYVAPYLPHGGLIVDVTAFVIAGIKAIIIATFFMHLNIERRIAPMILVATLALMGVFYSGVASDIQAHQGEQWENVSAKEETARRILREGKDGEKLEEQIKIQLEREHRRWPADEIPPAAGKASAIMLPNP